MGKCLSDNQVEKFHSDGFLSPIRVFSINEALELKDKLESAEKMWPEAFSASARNNAHLNFEFLDSIVHNKNLLDAVEDILGPNILAYASTLFIKEPRDPGFVSWHQDARYIGLEPHNWVTAWLAIDDVDEHNGCMRMVSGSHKAPLKDHVDTFGQDNILTRGQTVPDINIEDSVPVIMKAGQLSLHHPRIVHGSGPNHSDKRRMGFAIQSYIGANVNQVIGKIWVQQARGDDTYQYHQYAGRPSKAMQLDDLAFRQKTNDCLSDIFYAGADKKGQF